MGKISHEPAGRGRGSPPYEGAIVSKEDVDILRALLATQTLGEAVSKARASVDASKTTSIYDVDAPFKTFWLWGKTRHSRLKVPCWPQHVFFLAGIILFCVGSIIGVINSAPVPV